jgi:hypothetical protein
MDLLGGALHERGIYYPGPGPLLLPSIRGCQPVDRRGNRGGPASLGLSPCVVASLAALSGALALAVARDPKLRTVTSCMRSWSYFGLSLPDLARPYLHASVRPAM